MCCDYNLQKEGLVSGSPSSSLGQSCTAGSIAAGGSLFRLLRLLHMNNAACQGGKSHPGEDKVSGPIVKSGLREEDAGDVSALEQLHGNRMGEAAANRNPGAL